MKRVNEALENSKNLRESRLQLAKREVEKINEKAAEREQFMDRYYAIRAMQERKERNHGLLMEAARNDAFATVIKAIYITALEAEALTDEGIMLAESMVDKWINENGGASKILGKVGNNTYLLSRITQIVEDAATADVAEIEAEEDEPAADNKENVINNTKEFIKNASAEDVNDLMDSIVSSIKDKGAEEQKEEIKQSLDGGESEAPAEDTNAQASATSDSTSEETPAADTTGEESEAPTTDNTQEETPTTDETSGEEAPATTDDTEAAPADETSTEDNNSNEELEAPSTEDDGQEATPAEETPATDNTSGTEELESPADTSTDETEETPATDNTSGTEELESPADTSTDETEETPVEDDESDPLSGSIDDDEEESEEDDEIVIDSDDDGEEDTDEEVEDSLGEPVAGDEDNGSDTDTTIDGDTENTGRVFDELDKEEDVQKAVELIRTRVANAEENFIRNNAEDKKKINQLLDKISTNVKTVEDLNNKNDEKSKIAEESARLNKQRIDRIRENRPLTVFEKMSRLLSESIIKDEVVREAYSDELGKVDFGLVVESTKIMYGFLETINTLQLEKVDAKYIKNILENM